MSPALAGDIRVSIDRRKDGMKSDTAATVALYNRRSFQSLVRTIELSQGEFCLILARCNDRRWRDYLTQQLQHHCSVPIQRFNLPASTVAFDVAIQDAFTTVRPKALVAFRLESVQSVEKFLSATDANREQLQQCLSAPLVLWVSDEILQKVSRFAPALYSWASRTISFLALTSHSPSLPSADSQSYVTTSI